MTELAKSDLFFFISSIGFALIGIMIIILLMYLIKAVRSFQGLVEKMESEINNLGDTANDLVDDIRNSFLYKFVFNPRKRRILSTKLYKNEKQK